MNFIIIMVFLGILAFLLNNNENKNSISPKLPVVQEEKKTDDERFLEALTNVSAADKVILKNVTEKWSLNKYIIDDKINDKLTKIAKDVINKTGINSGNHFHIKSIDHVYIMKDKDKNFRAIMSFFVHDVRNFHTIKIILDIVSINKIIYINHIDIDESGIKNVIKNYDIRLNSHGILSNYNMFDEDTRILLDNYYRTNYKVVELSQDDYITNRSSLFTLDQLVDDYLPANVPTKDSPMFCDKYSFDWDSSSTLLKNNKDCSIQNPSIRSYPNTPYFAPGVVTNNVDQNKYDWLYEIDRGHTLP